MNKVTQPLHSIFSSIFFLIFITNISAQSWSPVGTGSGVSQTVLYSMTVHNNELYAAGIYDTAAGNAGYAVSKWDGVTWAPVGLGMTARIPAELPVVYSLLSFQNELYAGGVFTSIGGVAAKFIAKWNGSTWSPVDTVLNEVIRTLMVYNGELYAGGAFNTGVGSPADFVAKWNGNTWVAVGTGIISGVICMEVYNGELYAGGNFNQLNGGLYKYIAKWNGNTWSSVGGGTDEAVYAMKVYNNELYVSGNFNMAGGQIVNSFAKWDGTNWSAVAPRLYGGANSFQVYNSSLIGVGILDSVCSIPAKNAFKWDGTNCSTMSSGLNHWVFASAVFQGDFYAGGSFSTAGGIPAHRIARWSEPVGIDVISENEEIKLYPNPAFDKVKIDGLLQHAKISMLDVTGKCISAQTSQSSPFEFSMKELKDGLYLVKIETEENIFYSRVVKKSR